MQDAGSGGDGAAGTFPDGEDGKETPVYEFQSGANSGGGAGGAGRIRINTEGAAANIQPGAVISPTMSLGQCTGLCTQGPVKQ